MMKPTKSNELQYEIRESEHSVGNVFIPRGPWKADLSLRANGADIQGIRLSRSAGYEGVDIRFLANYPNLRSVEIYSEEIKDLSVLACMNKLEVIGLQTSAAKGLDLDCFPVLRVALVQWKKDMNWLLDCRTLQYLNAINYPFSNFEALSSLVDLKRLSITSRKLESLSGIEKLSSLRRIDLFQCPNLVSIEPLHGCSGLEEIEIASCRHIDSNWNRGARPN